MGTYTIKMPDIGEGIAEAELVEWLIEDGQEVREDELLAAVMTDKATVEIPSPVQGKIIWRGATIGEVVAVGAPLIKLDIEGEGNDGELVATPTEEAKAEPATNAVQTSELGSVEPEIVPSVTNPKPVTVQESRPQRQAIFRAEGKKPIASPAVRIRAIEAGVDLRQVAGSGPAGRIQHSDLTDFLSSRSRSGGGTSRSPNLHQEDIKLVGLRRKISEKMSISKSRIPHITYVEEVDVSELEILRRELNTAHADQKGKLTFIPFLVLAMIKAIKAFPQMNATFDDQSDTVHRSGGVHVGIAAQTDKGLMVPVLQHAETLGLWQIASEIGRLSRAARDGSASRDELSGSTITITSLGAMGGIVTTPVINHPEVAIVGVNKMRVAPIWDGESFKPRSVLNLSSSFDHRIIDGWDAALFVQKIRSLLEVPATLFIEGLNDD